MTKLEFHRKLVLIERERDLAREEALRYRDKLLELAKECAQCDGTGLCTEDVIPCSKCCDIRELLE